MAAAASSRRALFAFDAGLGARGRAIYATYMRELAASGDPVFRARQQIPGS